MRLPSDCQLLTTQKGGLAISPSFGTYCAVMPEECDAFRACLKPGNRIPDEGFPDALRERLKVHGFFGEPRPFRKPYQLLQFQVTNACNLRCAYCSADSCTRRPNEITLDQVKKVIDEALDIRPDIKFSFTGGEPLLVPWIFDAIDYALKKSRHEVGLLSNLLLLKRDETLFKKIVALAKDRRFQLLMSMSGADREVCNRLSGRDCYDDGIEVLRRLGAEGALPSLDIMHSAPDARANIEAFADFRRALPRDLKISMGILYPCGREKGEHTFKDADTLEETLDEIAFEGGVSIPAPTVSPLTLRRKACQCIENGNLYIRSDGAIFSCFKLVEQFGHISEGIKTVIERRQKTAVLAADLEMCRRCPFVSICASGCRADTLILGGNTKAPICGNWRRQLIAEMLFEDKPYIIDWPIPHQLAEARKRGIETPKFIITQLKPNLV